MKCMTARDLAKFSLVSASGRVNIQAPQAELTEFMKAHHKASAANLQSSDWMIQPRSMRQRGQELP